MCRDGHRASCRYSADLPSCSRFCSSAMTPVALCEGIPPLNPWVRRDTCPILLFSTPALQAPCIGPPLTVGPPLKPRTPCPLQCDKCPDNANCTVLGLPWATLPTPGYWHSGPRSPNIKECTNPDACTGSQDWPRQVRAYAWLWARRPMPVRVRLYLVTGRGTCVRACMRGPLRWAS